METLAIGILTQAVKDWKKLISKNAKESEFNELRRFFQSPWAMWLFSVTEIEPEEAYQTLEKERVTNVH